MIQKLYVIVDISLIKCCSNGVLFWLSWLLQRLMHLCVRIRKLSWSQCDLCFAELLEFKSVPQGLSGCFNGRGELGPYFLGSCPPPFGTVGCYHCAEIEEAPVSTETESSQQLHHLHHTEWSANPLGHWGPLNTNQVKVGNSLDS